MAYHDALMDRPGGLTKAEREMIVVATTAANNCLYCVVAHGAILRVRAKKPLLADQVAVAYAKADITPRQRAMAGLRAEGGEGSPYRRGRGPRGARGHGFQPGRRLGHYRDHRPVRPLEPPGQRRRLRPNDESTRSGGEAASAAPPEQAIAVPARHTKPPARSHGRAAAPRRATAQDRGGDVDPP